MTPGAAGLGARHRARTSRNRVESWRPRSVWGALAAPGGIWLAALILVPFYVVCCVAFGTLDPIFQAPVPVWNPFAWNGAIGLYVPLVTYSVWILSTTWCIHRALGQQVAEGTEPG